MHQYFYILHIIYYIVITVVTVVNIVNGKIRLYRVCLYRILYIKLLLSFGGNVKLFEMTVVKWSGSVKNGIIVNIFESIDIPST